VMPRPRPPHLQREITRHGKAVWYVRVNRGPRVRLKAEFGTPEFDAEYRAALSGTPTRKATQSNSRLHGCLLVTVRLRHGPNYLPPQGEAVRISLPMSLRLPVMSLMHESLKQQFLLAKNAALLHHMLHAIF